MGPTDYPWARPPASAQHRAALLQAHSATGDMRLRRYKKRTHALLAGCEMMRWPQVDPARLSQNVWWEEMDGRARQTWASPLTGHALEPRTWPL